MKTTGCFFHYLLMLGLSVVIFQCKTSVNGPTSKVYEPAVKLEVIFDTTLEFPNSQGGEACAIKEFDAGRYFVGGRQQTVSGNKAFLVCLSQNGDVRWHQQYNGSNIYSFIQARSGALLATGYDLGGRVYVVKTDANGNLLWEQWVDYPYADGGYEIIETYDSSFVVASNSYAVQTNSRIFKINGDGTVVWLKEIPGIDRSITSSVFENTDHTLTLFGTSRKSSSDMYDTSWCVRLDQNGNELNRFVVPGRGYSLYNQWHESTLIQAGVNQLAATTFNTFYMMDTLGIVNTTITVSPFSDEQGNSQFPNSLRIYSVAKTNNGDFILSGFQSKTIATTDTGNVIHISSVSHGALFMMSSTGANLWGVSIGNMDRDFDPAYSIIQSSDGAFVICGQASYPGGNRYPVWIKKVKITG